MPISDREHFDALRKAEQRRTDDLRAADQRAIELLATANAAGTSRAWLIASFMLNVAMAGVALAALVWKR